MFNVKILDLINAIFKIVPYMKYIKIFLLNIYRRLFLCNFITGKYEYFYWISVHDIDYINKLEYFFKKDNTEENIPLKNQNEYILNNWIFKKNIDYIYFIKFKNKINNENNPIIKEYSEGILNIILKYYCIKKIYFGKYSKIFNIINYTLYLEIKKNIPFKKYNNEDELIYDVKKEAQTLYEIIFNIVYFKNNIKNKEEDDLILSYKKLDLTITNHCKLILNYKQYC